MVCVMGLGRGLRGAAVGAHKATVLAARMRVAFLSLSKYVA